MPIIMAARRVAGPVALSVSTSLFALLLSSTAAQAQPAAQDPMPGMSAHDHSQMDMSDMPGIIIMAEDE